MKRSLSTKFKESAAAIVHSYRLHGFRTGILAMAAKIPVLRSVVRVLTGGRLIVPVRVHGAVMFVDVFDPGISWQLLSRGTREDAHVAQIQGVLMPGMRGIEMGANIGFFTIIEAPLVGPDGFIWCIEPVPQNLQLLRRTIAANGYANRTAVFQHLIGDRDGQGTIHLSEASNSHSISATHATAGSLEVPMVTVDSFMAQHGIMPSSIDFIRMDVEGYEVVAVTGMERLLRESPRLKFFIELHPQAYEQWGWTLEKFLRHLEGFGLRIKQAAKERERDEQGRLVTRILNNPSILELCDAVDQQWHHGGVQAYLEKA